jgi:hypothetical protein
VPATPKGGTPPLLLPPLLLLPLLQPLQQLSLQLRPIHSRCSRSTDQCQRHRRLQELHRWFVTQLRNHRYVNSDNEAGHVMDSLTPLLREDGSLMAEFLEENHAVCTAAPRRTGNQLLAAQCERCA